MSFDEQFSRKVAEHTRNKWTAPMSEWVYPGEGDVEIELDRSGIPVGSLLSIYPPRNHPWVNFRVTQELGGYRYTVRCVEAVPSPVAIGAGHPIRVSRG